MSIKISITLFALIAGSTIGVAQEKLPKNKKESSPLKTEQQQDSIYYACKMHPDVTSDRQGKCSQCNLPLEKQITSRTRIKSPKMEGVKNYTCPNHPYEKSDKPGKCPQCGLDLIIDEKIK